MLDWEEGQTEEIKVSSLTSSNSWAFTKIPFINNILSLATRTIRWVIINKAIRVHRGQIN